MAGKIRFTKAALEALPIPAQGKRVYHHDDKARGLCLCVAASGTKPFYVLRKFKGKTERVLIGRFPDTTIAQARTSARDVNAQMDKGINPNEQKRERRGELTLGELFEAYMEGQARPHNRRPDVAEHAFRTYLCHWANRKLSDIDKRKIAALMRQLGESRGHRTANKVHTLLRAMFNRARDWDMWSDNPTQGIQRYKERSRDRFLQPEELPRFFDALSQEPSELVRDFLMILLLTGARRGNVQAMRWQDVNLESRYWKIPDTKIGESHTLPLAPEALAILGKRREQVEGEFAFPGPGREGHLMEPKQAWQNLLQRAGIEDLRMHDLRRTHGSYMAATGANLSVIGKALGHKDISTTTIYARLDLDPVRQAVNTATSTMMQDAGSLIPSGEVLDFHRGATNRKEQA